MATEWYLMNSPHDVVSGFGTDDFNNFAVDGFVEALESPLGEDVEIFEYDLTSLHKTRAIVQNKIEDTQLKTTRRTMLLPIDSCEAGQYILYKGRYWLVYGLVDDNGIYEKAVVILCNYLLTWKTADGRIVQRWINATSASQYNNGETSTKFYWVRSDQLMVLIPDDDDVLMLPHKQRFIIDRRCDIYEKSFSDDVVKDTSNPLMTYELTRMDNVLFDYQNSGYVQFMVYQHEQMEEDGFYKIDGKGYWLCESPTEKEEENKENKSDILSSYIECDTKEIYCGIEPSVFFAKFVNSAGEVVEKQPRWEIDCDFKDKLFVEFVGDAISIFVEDENLINKSFRLSLGCEGYEPTDITITIKAFI